VKVQIVAAVLIGLSPNAAVGQEVCGQIVQSAIYNQMSSVATNKRYDLNKANFCVVEYDHASEGQQAQIKASYGPYRGQGGWSTAEIRERQRAECSNDYGEHRYDQEGFIEQRMVSEKAMETVDSCIKALASKLRVEPKFTEDERSVMVHLTWAGRGELPFRGSVGVRARMLPASLGITTSMMRAYSTTSRSNRANRLCSRASAARRWRKSRAKTSNVCSHY